MLFTYSLTDFRDSLPSFSINLIIAESTMTPSAISCSQNSLNALAIDVPLEYARLALDGEMQVWVDAIDSLEVW